MDTRQLAAFCAVVERKSFSQAAERLGVTQPAVSLQIRSLEQRLGRQLLDRSGRRVEPTEAGLRLYAAAQRVLHAEDQMLEELEADDEGTVVGTLELGASTGPGGSVVPVLLCEFQERHPDVHVRLSVSDTQTVAARVADRELGLGIVGAGRGPGRSTSGWGAPAGGTAEYGPSRSSATRWCSRSPPHIASRGRRSRSSK